MEPLVTRLHWPEPAPFSIFKYLMRSIDYLLVDLIIRDVVQLFYGSRILLSLLVTIAAV